MGFEVFGVGVPEMVIILVVALIFLGPDKLPEAARTLGGWVREIRGLTSEATSIWRETLEVGEEIRETVRSVPAAMRPQIPPAPNPTSFPLVFTPPAKDHIPAEGAAPPPLEYPAPFEAAGPAPAKPPRLEYPAPFEE